MKDLFGNDTNQEFEIPKKLTGSFQIYRASYHYRLGTETENCKKCKHRCSSEYHNKWYHKCELQGLSHSENSDIRLRNVCDNFKVEGEKTNE